MWISKPHIQEKSRLFHRKVIQYSSERLNPKDAESHNNRGLAKVTLGQLQDGLSDYNKAIQLNPNVDAYYNRGRVNEMLGRFEEAVADFKRAIRLNPKDIEARRALNHLQAKFN